MTTTTVNTKTRLTAGLAWLDREIEETTHMIESMQKALDSLEAERDFIVESLEEGVKD